MSLLFTAALSGHVLKLMSFSSFLEIYTSISKNAPASQLGDYLEVKELSEVEIKDDNTHREPPAARWTPDKKVRDDASTAVIGIWNLNTLGNINIFLKRTREGQFTERRIHVHAHLKENRAWLVSESALRKWTLFLEPLAVSALLTFAISAPRWRCQILLRCRDFVKARTRYRKITSLCPCAHFSKIHVRSS